MITKKQAETVAHVYKKMLGMEIQGWTNLDESMITLDYLNETEIYNEAYILLQEHKTRHIIPDLDVPNPSLLVPMIIEAVATLLAAHKNPSKMDNRSKYILQQYLALHYVKKLSFIARTLPFNY